MIRQDVLQEPDPSLPDAGLAVWQADKMRPERRGDRSEDSLTVGERHAADQMDEHPTNRRGLPRPSGVFARFVKRAAPLSRPENRARRLVVDDTHSARTAH